MFKRSIKINFLIYPQKLALFLNLKLKFIEKILSVKNFCLIYINLSVLKIDINIKLKYLYNIFFKRYLKILNLIKCNIITNR